MGHPIRASTNAGLSIRPAFEVSLPSFGVAGAGRPIPDWTIWALSGGLFRSSCDGPPLFSASCVVGVDHSETCPGNRMLPFAYVDPGLRPESELSGVLHSPLAIPSSVGRFSPDRPSTWYPPDSWALGVGHEVATFVRLGLVALENLALRPLLPSVESVVGHRPSLASVDKLGVPALGRRLTPLTPLTPFCELPYSTAVGVGQEEESGALVGRSDIGCS